MTEREPWRDRRYQRMRSVAYDAGNLIVLFEDGSCVAVSADRTLPAGASQPEWTSLEFDEYEIRVQTRDGFTEISWSTIRALTDKQYSAHLVSAAGEQARLVGRRISDLRRGRGLTGKELAQRAGITPQSLSRIEHGHHDVVFTTLQRILAAMDHSLSDLVLPEDESASVDS